MGESLKRDLKKKKDSEESKKKMGGGGVCVEPDGNAKGQEVKSLLYVVFITVVFVDLFGQGEDEAVSV